VSSVGKGMSEVIGREPELTALEEFLDRDTLWLALLLTGGPGIGKTALWERGLHLARGRDIRVLAARPSGAEAELSFAGLFDLLEGIDIGAVGGLPAPQRRALEAALLRAAPMDAAPERFAIAAGFLSVLRSLAAGEPLLIAVDDLQWLDAASAEVLAFAARRAQGQRFQFLLSRRSGAATPVERALDLAVLRTTEVGPLTLGATRRLLSQSLGLTVPPRTLLRLFDATQGNPLLALELGRALARGRTWAIGTEPPVADLAGNPFGARVAKLPAPAHRALLVTALSGHLSLPQLMTVADQAAVEDLVAAGLLIPDGERVRPSHPLVAAAARRHSRIGERQALHLALADVAGDETLRARHLALSAPAQDAEVAGIVAAAAASAARRGAAHDAADLAEHALRLTPEPAAEYPGRLLALAQCLANVGEIPRVTELLGPRIGELPAGGLRAHAHLLLGEDANLLEHEDHLEQALAHSRDDPALRATALATKSLLLAVVRVERISEAEALGAEAQRLARSAGPEVARHARQSLAWARILGGHPVHELTERAPGAAAGNYSLYEISIDRPAAVQLAFAGRTGPAQAALRPLLALAEERGEARFSSILTLHLCELALRAGELREGSRLLDEWADSGVLKGQRTSYLRCRALLASLHGCPDEAERWADAAAPAAGDPGIKWDQLEVLRARGIAALFAHEPERAAGALGQVWEHTLREGVADPGAFPVAPDLVEALVWLSRTAEAETVTCRLRDLAECRDHPWALATASRCAAVVRLAAGYDERTAARLADAAASYGELGLRFDRARSLLWLGRAARRARKRTAARRALETAGAEFDALGSPGWAAQARAELDLLGARRAASSDSLTAAEQRVVDLAASGLSNKQIARRLFVAVHTVEVHLAHAYAKLGVQSRAQLASRLASSAPPQATPAPQDTPTPREPTPAPQPTPAPRPTSARQATQEPTAPPQDTSAPQATPQARPASPQATD
jgi:DNA-binding CsgD family transcriptional regulator